METPKLEDLPRLYLALNNKVDILIERDNRLVEPQNERYNIKKAAEHVGYSVPTLYRFVKNRTIPFGKKGGRLFFYKNDLDLWLSQGRVKTVDELAEEVAAERG